MTQKYATGPRNDNYGFAEGVVPIEIAERYVGADASTGSDIWSELGEESWNFDLDEDELEEAGLLGSLYVNGDRFGLQRP